MSAVTPGNGSCIQFEEFGISADTEMIIGQADHYTPITIRPNSLTVAHAANFRLKKHEGSFRFKINTRRFCGRQSGTWTGFVSIISIFV